MNTQKQIVLMVALLFLFVGGCAAYTAIELPVRVPDQQQWTEDQSLERGALLFANNCRTCHGNTGEGGVGPQLRADPKSNFQNQDPLVLKANRALLQRTLACGRAGTLMPAWLSSNGGSLNAVQISHIVNFLSYPVAEGKDGEMTSKWWEEAQHFAQNLNGEVAVLVGGDTLGTIAKAHGIGPKELAAANNLPLEGTLKQGSEIKIPGFKGDPDGFTYTAYKDNETITKIAETQFVGALILADLNGIRYTFAEKRGTATLQLLTPEGGAVPGMFPGDKLKLPAGATYTVAAGDTKQTIATRHGITVAQLEGLNRDLLASLGNEALIPFEKTLNLPKPTAIVQAGQTLGTVAQLHGLKVDDLAAANSIAADAAVAVGTALKLPSGAKYVVQSGDTWEKVAKLHASNAAEIAAANGKQAADSLSPAVTLGLPPIDAYVVLGQDIKQIAGGYGNVFPDTLAAKNGIKETDLVAIGTQLKLPDDAWGGLPGDSRNPGTACVQYAVSNNAFLQVSGAATAVPVTQPPTASKDVKIDGNANDWTVTADGTKQAANKGVVLVAKGARIAFTSVVGLHTITSNTKKDGADLKAGDSRTITFNDAGQFKITCDYHPDMVANVYVQ